MNDLCFNIVKNFMIVMNPEAHLDQVTHFADKSHKSAEGPNDCQDDTVSGRARKKAQIVGSYSTPIIVK